MPEGKHEAAAEQHYTGAQPRSRRAVLGRAGVAGAALGAATLAVAPGSAQASGQYAVLGSDGTVGGPNGSPLSPAVALVNSPNVFTTQQTIAAPQVDGVLTVNNAGAAPGGKAVQIFSASGGMAMTMQTDYGALTSGQSTYDSLDILHKSAGDGVYVVHSGGVSQAVLITGSVSANSGIVYVQSPRLSGAQANGVSVQHVASGGSLSVTVSGSQVTVNLGSGGPTAAQVIAAVNASSAILLVSAFNLTDATGTSDGSGTVATMGATNLAGGFTGPTPGANAALNPYVPFWQEDTGAGTGSTVLYRMGRKVLLVTNDSAFDPVGTGVNISHGSGGGAITVYNQPPNQYGAPQVAGNGPCAIVNDWSTAASIHIKRNKAPADANNQALIKYNGAVFSVATGIAAAFPLLQATRNGVDNQGVFIRNDGMTALGLSYRPSYPARLWVDLGKPGGAAANLVLSNSSASSGSGAGAMFVANNVQHFAFSSAYATGIQTGTMTTTAQRNGANFHPLQLGPAWGYAAVITGSGGSDGVLSIVNQGNGPTLSVQVGKPSATTWQLDANANLRVVGTGGLTIATDPSQKLGFFGTAPVAQPAATVDTTYTAGSLGPVPYDSTFTGGAGSRAYTFGGIVASLKRLGLIAR